MNNLLDGQAQFRSDIAYSDFDDTVFSGIKRLCEEIQETGHSTQLATCTWHLVAAVRLNHGSLTLAAELAGSTIRSRFTVVHSIVSALAAPTKSPPPRCAVDFQQLPFWGNAHR